MQYVGGFRDYLALRAYTDEVDAMAFDDVLIAMAGDADAEAVSAAERRAAAVHASPR